jgi:hypothetical protein
MADYVKDFHNIRRLKFSHNIRPCAAARQREKAEKRRVRLRRKKSKKNSKKKEEEEEEEVRAEACVALGVLG